MKKTEKGQRTLYLDVARTAAIIFVCLNHAVNRSYVNYNGQMAEFLSASLISTLFKTFCTVASQLGVPLFLMISGVLILNKTMEGPADIKRFYRHNLFSIFLTAEIWYVLIYWFLLLFDPDYAALRQQGLGTALRGMVETMLFQNQLTFDSMWYIPMILCLYMTLPFAVIVKDKLSGYPLAPVLFLPALILFLNSMVLPAVNTLLRMNDLPIFSSKLREADLFSYFYLYVIAGYLVGKGYLAGWRLHWVALAAAVSFGLCCGFQFYAYSRPMDYVVSYNFPLLPVCGAFLFELFRRGAHRLRRMEKPIAYISRISFGIYFLHIVIMTVLNTVIDFTNWMPAVKLLFLLSASMLASVAVIAVLSRIKFLRKYLFLIK